MAITVIGHVTRDTLVFPTLGWKVFEGLGGILYTVSALARLAKEPVRPVCNVGEDLYDQVVSTLEQLPCVDTAYVKRVKGRHFHCYILFASEYGTQYDEGVESPITFSQIEPSLKDSSFILVSPMTGFDVDLPTLRRIKKNAECPVYLDYHLLALERDPLGNRFLRRRKNWLEWCTCCDHLQLNQFEAESLSQFPISTEADIQHFSAPLFREGVSSVAVTLGSNGALVGWRDKSAIQIRKMGAVSTTQVVDATGCGDVFAAGFIVHYSQTHDFLASYRFANRIAGLKCGFSGFEGLADLFVNNDSGHQPA